MSQQSQIHPDAEFYADLVGDFILGYDEEGCALEQIAAQFPVLAEEGLLPDVLAFLEETWPETSDLVFVKAGDRYSIVPRKPASNRPFLEVLGSEAGYTGDEIEVFGATSHDELPTGRRDGEALGPRDPSLVSDRGRWDADYERQRGKQPERKKDRHKGPRDRAAYMREYRARKANDA
jgi:hypothetical protein